MMRFSRLGLLALLIATVLSGSNCSYYNRVLARKNLVDGSKAYKDRKFPEAEQLFRDAVARDPKGETVEGKTAQLFLARTLHSEYIGNRSRRRQGRSRRSPSIKKALDRIDPERPVVRTRRSRAFSKTCRRATSGLRG